MNFPLSFRYLALSVVFLCISCGAAAQVAIGFGTNFNFSRPAIASANGYSEIFENLYTRNKGANYYLAYRFPKFWQIDFQMQTFSYNTAITSTLDDGYGFRYKMGNYWVPSINLHYRQDIRKVPGLAISLGAGAGTFCSHCPKAAPMYIEKQSTTKSNPYYYSTGVYSNGWESEYQATRIYTANVFLGIEYTLYNYHIVSVQVQYSRGNNWSYRHIIRYENNGIVPGNDKYEDASITVEQRHALWAINLKYELKLSAFSWLWEKSRPIIDKFRQEE